MCSRALTLACFLAAAAVIVSGCGREPQNLTEMSPEVRQARDRLGPQEAVQRAKAEAQEENTADAWDRLAQSYTLVNKPREAMEALEKALELDPNHPRAIVGMTQIKLRQGKAEEAEELARRLLDDKGNGPPAAQLLVGRALMAKDRSEEALKLLEHGVGSHPNYPALSYTLGDAYLADDRFDDALKAYNEAVRKDPKQPGYHRALIRAYIRADRLDDAIAAARNATETLPDSAEVWFLEGTVCARDGRVNEAIEAYDQALLVDPDFIPAANNLAVLLADENTQLNRANELARKAVRQAPKNHAFADTYGWVLVRSGQYEKGIQLLEAVQDNWPDSPAVKWHLGYALVKSGKVERGRKLIEQAAQAEGRPDISGFAREFLNSMDEGG